MTTRDPLSPQWEDCKVCGGDHWTKDHPHDTPEAAIAAALRKTADERREMGYAEDEAAAILAAMPGWTLVPKPVETATIQDCDSGRHWHVFRSVDGRLVSGEQYATEAEALAALPPGWCGHDAAAIHQDGFERGMDTANARAEVEIGRWRSFAEWAVENNGWDGSMSSEFGRRYKAARSPQETP
jgi:hypothetical protein